MSSTQFSSNKTIFLKLILPTIWIVFFGCFTVLALVSSPFDSSGAISPVLFKILIVSFYVSSIGILWLLTMRIKRVDADEEYIYVSNYMRVYRYTWESVEKITVGKGLLMTPVVIHFHAKTSFGKAVSFYASPFFYTFMNEHPDITPMSRA